MTARRLLLLFGALGAAGCSRCGEAPLKMDSGVQVSALTRDGGPVVAVGDVRQALVIAVPEFRGVSNLVAIAVVERKLLRDPSNGGDLVGSLEPQFEDKRWKAASSDAGALIAQNKPFFAEAERRDGVAIVRVGLVLPGEDFAKLFQTPAPITSQQLAMLMPIPKGIGFSEQTFTVEVHYSASDERAAELIRQLVDGHLKAGWSVEEGTPELFRADAGNLPEKFRAVLRDPHTGGRLTLGRTGTRTVSTWEQTLYRR